MYTLAEIYWSNLHAFYTPTHSPKKLTPFFKCLDVFPVLGRVSSAWRCGYNLDFDECVSTNVLQLEHINRKPIKTVARTCFLCLEVWL